MIKSTSRIVLYCKKTLFVKFPPVLPDFIIERPCSACVLVGSPPAALYEQRILPPSVITRFARKDEPFLVAQGKAKG